MGLIKFFSEILHDITDSLKPKNDPTAAPIPESEKKYYRPDSYYTSRSYEGTGFGKPVITFEERKKTCIPSRTGLYVAEILLLEYCTYGTYPAPKNGYPGFWWFEYGIRNVGAALKSLEERGYIKYGCLAYSLKELTVPDLKELLKQHGMATTGKKAELIERAAANINEADLLSFGMVPKYELTALGESELKENEYVPYMHKNSRKTNDSMGAEFEFNVWSINRLLGNNDKSNWKEIVDKESTRVYSGMDKRHDDDLSRSVFEERMKNDKEFAKFYSEMEKQNEILELIQENEARLKDDTNALIEFWEKLWKDSGSYIVGNKWHFRLPNLYVKARRYDDALSFCNRLKSKKPSFTEEAESYITKIEELKMKTRQK